MACRLIIIWIIAGILLIGPLGTNFNEVLIKIKNFPLKKHILKCLQIVIFLGPNVLRVQLTMYMH